MLYRKIVNILKNFVQRFLLSWDFFAAFLVALLTNFYVHSNILNDFARDIYNVGITTLSIIFSAYFAALAIIVSLGDSEFIDFFDEDGDYTRLIKSFRLALLSLLVALLIAIALYAFSSFLFYGKYSEQPKVLLTLFSFFSIYGIIATFIAANDAINYALCRVKFLRFKRGEIEKKRLEESKQSQHSN